MKEKPQIKVYEYKNNTFHMIAIIDDYMEVSTEDNLYECGSFTCSINLNLPNASIFKRGLFLDINNNLYEITSITDSIGSDGKGSQVRQITGYDARNILKRRIVRSMNANGNFELTAKGEICLRRVIEAQCGLSAEEKRRLPITNIIPSIENAQGSVYALSVSYSNLYEVCKTIATQSGIGWKFIFDGESLNLVVYTGQDKSTTVRFSPDMDSLADGSYTDSSDSYASCVYVGGKGQNGEQDIYEGEIDGATGLDRFEVFDNKTELTTEAEYKAEAESMLLQYNKNISISGNGLAHCPYEYGKQYNVGDFITVAFSGHSAKVQILSVTQSWQYGQYGLQFEYGKPLATLDGQLQAIMRKVQEGNKPRTTDSVMWYTLPQDTEQSKDEIKYDTIGFMGSTATQSTFTLYLDEEKNGAKTYHVYLKELNGNSLTLTTGRTGAKDLTISTGTYVLIVYVDENGNVNEQGTTATDVVVQGNTQPVTSDAVATAIQQVSNSVPVGAVMAFAQGTTHENWLLCDGRDTTGTTEELQTKYPALYTYLGNSNVLPKIYDKSKAKNHLLSEFVSVAGDWTIPYDGTIFLCKGNSNVDTETYLTTTLANGTTTKIKVFATYGFRATIVVKKGDILTLSSGTAITGNLAKSIYTYSTEPLYIKATSAGIEVDRGLYATKGYVNDTVSYSTTEQPTGGTWIDNKPIYRKVYTITPVRLRDDTSHSFVDATLDVEQLVVGSAIGYRYNNANNKVVNALNCYFDPSDKSIHILNRGWDFYCVNIILEYTKTND